MAVVNQPGPAVCRQKVPGPVFIKTRRRMQCNCLLSGLTLINKRLHTSTNQHQHGTVVTEAFQIPERAMPGNNACFLIKHRDNLIDRRDNAGHRAAARNINKWKEGFLRKTLENIHYGLKPNKFLAFNVADVRSYNTFEKDTKQLALETGFKLVDTFDLRMSSQQQSHKDEPIFIFKCIK